MATRRLRPRLASHAPKVRRIIEKKIDGFEEKNGSIITKIRTRPSSRRSAISRWVRCSISVSIINRVNIGSRIIGVNVSIS